MRESVWANWVRDQRRAKQLTRRKLAELTAIDPSYVTLIERDGYIPRREVCGRIGKVLSDEETGQIMAGFVPLRLRRQMLGCKDSEELGRLPGTLRHLVALLSTSTPSLQTQATSLLTALVTSAPRSRAPHSKRRAH